MAWPDSAETKPPASTTLSGNDGNLAHTAYDTALHQQVSRIGTALLGARGTFATLALRLASLDGKVSTIRAVNGTAASVGVGFAAAPNMGLALSTADETAMIAGGVKTAHWNTLNFQVFKQFVVSAGSVLSNSARVFMPGLQQSAGGSLAYVRWDATAGELIVATSSRRNKVNEQPIANGLELLRAIQPTRYDLADTDPAIINGGARRQGYTDAIPGFIAEDIAQVDPGLAASTADGTPTGVDVEAILAVVAAAVRQLDAKVTALMDDAA